MTAERSQRRDASPYEGHRLVALGRRAHRKMAFTAGVHTALQDGGWWVGGLLDEGGPPDLPIMEL